MKKLGLLLLIINIVGFLFSAETEQGNTNTSSLKTQLSNFTAASLDDKVLIVKKAPKDTEQAFFEHVLNFAIEKREYLENFPSYYPLLLSSIESLNENASDTTDTKLLVVYNNFDDYNIRMAILQAFTKIKVDDPKILSVVLEIVNTESTKTENISTELLIKGLDILANIADITSFDLIYSCYKKSINNEVTQSATNALYSLSPSYNEKVLDIVEKGDLTEKILIFNIVTSNPKKDINFDANVAQKLLSETINIDDEVTNLSQEQISLQLSAVNILANANWTKAADLVCDYFNIAIKEYESLLITEQEFVSVIQSMNKFPTTNTCKVLTKFLTSQYDDTLNSGTYNANVLLAVINTLGELGDKEAFDALLYIISCPDYSDEIISASRSALEKLKWKW